MERYFQKRIRSLDLDDNAAGTSRLKHPIFQKEGNPINLYI
jgi:hypothetical protein